VPQDYDDPFQAATEGYMAMGYEKDEVAMALAALGTSASQESVVEFCRRFANLKSMGFNAALVLGALVLHGEDITAATDACLACQ
jgi:hypothetical protein